MPHNRYSITWVFLPPKPNQGSPNSPDGLSIRPDCPERTVHAVPITNFSRKSRFRRPFLFFLPCRIIIRFIHKAPSSDLRACNTRRVIWNLAWETQRDLKQEQERVLIKILNRFLIHFDSFWRGGSIKNFWSFISRVLRTPNSRYSNGRLKNWPCNEKRKS